MKKWVAGMVLMSLLILSAFPAEAREPSDQREFRAFWVDAFHDGIKTPEQVDKLIADAQRANVNALIVQVRRRGMPILTGRWSRGRRTPPCNRVLMRSNT